MCRCSQSTTCARPEPAAGPAPTADLRSSLSSCNARTSRMCGKPVRRLEQAHRARGVCDRTFVLARCGGCLSPVARTHTGRLLERASLRSSRKMTRTGPRHPAAGAPPGSAAADAGTRTVAVSGAGADAPAPADPSGAPRGPARQDDMLSLAAMLALLSRLPRGEDDRDADDQGT
jgi:hypothetical protein